MIFENRDKMDSKEFIQTILKDFYNLWEYPIEKLYNLLMKELEAILRFLIFC